MEKIADKLTKYIVKINIISETEYEIYKYGFVIGLEFFLCAATCFMVAAWISMITEYILFLVTFFVLRSYIGGIHMRSYWACYILSCTVIIISLLGVKYYSLSSGKGLFIAFIEIIIVELAMKFETKETDVNLDYLLKAKYVISFVYMVLIIFYGFRLNTFANTILNALSVLTISLLLEKIEKGIVEKRREN